MNTANSEQTCVFSIIVGYVSTTDREQIINTINALFQQDGQLGYEVIIATRKIDAICRKLCLSYPGIKIALCDEGSPLPAMHTTALNHALGEYVVVTEDHCVPTKDWLLNIQRAFLEAPANTVAIGGCVENGVVERPLDWATFLCEYGAFMQPVTEGLTTTLPGMNIAYKRNVIAEIDKTSLRSGFWEQTLHPRLLDMGLCFVSSNAVKVSHCKTFSFLFFAKQRYLYSRYFGAMRAKKLNYVYRLFYLIITVYLPVLFMYRLSRHMFVKRNFIREFLLASPILLIFFVIAAGGEAIGLMLGDKDSLLRIE
ncbi:MAG: glycosyltransferase family 2 protein [Gammaproteobacteria bacterium]|nr:glycosyltransferase family 2 protein [Gammaproteobacteria bacterium]